MLPINQTQIQQYQRDGFIKIPGIISPEEARTFREAALIASEKFKGAGGNAIFDQSVNVWNRDETLRGLTFHPNLVSAARALAGKALRLWHDQILIKPPQNRRPTEFHQDQPYWPHANSTQPITAWVALSDVPAERGAMSFIPESHRYTDLTAQNLGDAKSLFGLCPELIFEPRVTHPLRAGDCTFHHGRCAHMANDNSTDEPRVALAVIYMDAETTFSGARHPVTEHLNYELGSRLEGELFPLLGE